MFEKISRLAIKLYSGCNMNCDYCFQTFEEKYRSKEFTDYVNLYNFLHSLPYDDKVIVTFCGGEMTLKPELIKECIKKVFKKIEREHDVTFAYAMISNGTNIQTLLNMFDENVLTPSLCNVSWDGLYSISKSRKCPQFSDEYMKRNIKKIGESPYNDSLSVVHALTPSTIDYLADSFKYLLENNVLSFGYYPIHEANYSDDFCERFKKQLEIIYEMVDNAYKNHLYINFFNLETLKVKQKSLYFTCTKLGYNYYINTAGDIYPCIYFGDNGLYKFGNIKDGIDENIIKQFEEDYLHYPKCDYKNCKCVFCGECPAACAVHNGNMNIKFQNLCKIRKIEKEIFDSYYEKLSKYPQFNTKYTEEDYILNDELSGFKECELHIVEHPFKQPHYDSLKNW